MSEQDDRFGSAVSLEQDSLAIGVARGRCERTRVGIRPGWRAALDRDGSWCST